MVKFKKFQASLVKLSGSVSIDALAGEIFQFVQDNIKSLNDERIDPSLLRFLCNVVENSHNKNNIVDGKIDKKKLVLDVYIKLKPQANSQDVKDTLSSLIEDYHTSGQIKKITCLSYWYKLFKKNVLSKKG